MLLTPVHAVPAALMSQSNQFRLSLVALVV
jgi:hypothetical protein